MLIYRQLFPPHLLISPKIFHRERETETETERERKGGGREGEGKEVRG